MLHAPADLPASGSLEPVPPELSLESEWGDLGETEKDLARRRVSANQEPLDALVEASRRPRLWLPAVRDVTRLSLEYALPASSLEALADALGGRAEVRRAQERMAEARADAEALRRLECLVDQGSGLMVRMVACGVRRRTLDWLTRALESGASDEALCMRTLHVVQHLPVPRDFATDIDRFDRYWVLGAYVLQVKQEVRRTSGRSEEVVKHPAYARLNAALSEINRELDEVVPLLRSHTREGEEDVKRHVEERVARLKRAARMRPGDILERLVFGGPKIGSRVGQVLAGQILVLLPTALMSARGCELQRRLVVLALALRLHALRHGSFPDTLEDLVPALLETIPANPVDGTPIPYEREGDGCRVGEGESAIELSLKAASPPDRSRASAAPGDRGAK